MQTDRRFFLTMAAIIKDEGPYLGEWIEYHALLGVEHVYIYDNGSSDGPADVLRDYIVQGRVTLLYWPEFPGQLSAYSHAVNIFGRDSEWMILVDVDEFVRLPEGQDLRSFLAGFRDRADQILLPWYHFGGSGHETRPDGLVIENYVHRTDRPHHQPKTIVRPAAVTFTGIHHCETRSGRTVDSSGQPAPERWILPEPPRGDVYIHHYFTKSRSEFAAKIARGQADGGGGKSLTDFHRFDTPVHDDALAAFGPRVRRALAETAERPRRPAVHAAWSAQSELTSSESWQKNVSRIWTSLQSMTGNGSNLGRLDVVPSRIALHGVACPAALVARALDDMRDALDIFPVAEVTDWAIPSDRRISGKGGLGRPCLIWRGRSDHPATMTVTVEGKDAGGKPWRQQRQFAVDPLGTTACLILSERTMVVERISFSEDRPAGAECVSGAVVGFV